MDELQLIQSKIYKNRGQKVMLDFDLAEMYEVETRALNQAVKRNIERFPEDFMYQLAKDEWQNMSSQFVMTSRNKRPKTAIPLAFTEHGVKCAQKQYSYPSKCFNRSCLRRHPSTDSQSTGRQSGELEKQIKELRAYMEEVFTDYNDINEDTRMQLEMINQTLAELQVRKRIEEKPRNPIGFR